MKAFETPVLFIIFNRPDTTQAVFDEIQRLKPKRLFVTADGPREGKLGDKEKCDATRKVIEQIDWDCEVKTRFLEKNLGCKMGVSTGISWFFEQVDEGIILEDDCVPDPSFFAFCRELLEKYRGDERIMHIAGTNYQNGRTIGDGSYYFSKFNHVWGWATWRRAWSHYDVAMKTYPVFKKMWQIENVWSDRNMQKCWTSIFDKTFGNGIDTWDYQWEYAILNQNGLCVIPNINMVSNIGFGPEATHTKESSSMSRMDIGPILKIEHPSFVLVDRYADERTFNTIFYPSLGIKVERRVRVFLKKIGILK